MNQNCQALNLRSSENENKSQNEETLRNTYQQQYSRYSQELKQKVLEGLFQLMRNQIEALQLYLSEIQFLEKQGFDGIEEIQYDSEGNEKVYQEFLHQLKISRKLSSQFDQQIEKLILKISKKQNPNVVNYKNFPQNLTKSIEIFKLQQQREYQQTAIFTYRMLPEYSKIQIDQCQAIAIDNSNQFMISGCLHEIKIFQLQGEKLALCQIAKQHTQKITLLLFMKTSNGFISIGEDKMICIWKYKLDNLQWEVSQMIQYSEDQIQCLTIDYEDKYFVYGSFIEDSSAIKFFKKLNQKWMFDFYFLVIGRIKNLCFNNSSDILISTSEEGLFVMQKQYHYWHASMSIFKKKYGTQMIFINNKQFAVQSEKGNQLFIYQQQKIDQDDESELGVFHKIKLLELNHTAQFPLRYIEEKGLIVTKDNLTINMVQQQSNGDYVWIKKLVQNVEIGNIGDVSYNGLYFITWNQENQIFQVRRLEEQ